MAIKREFNGMNISLPGYDGFVKCPGCGEGDGSPIGRNGGAYCKAGPIPREDGSSAYWRHTFHIKCGYNKEEGKEERDAYLKRMGRL